MQMYNMYIIYTRPEVPQLWAIQTKKQNDRWFVEKKNLHAPSNFMLYKVVTIYASENVEKVAC